MNIEEKTYQKITPATEGNYLTTYKEGDDIKTYERCTHRQISTLQPCGRLPRKNI